MEVGDFVQVTASNIYPWFNGSIGPVVCLSSLGTWVRFSSPGDIGIFLESELRPASQIPFDEWGIVLTQVNYRFLSELKKLVPSNYAHSETN